MVISHKQGFALLTIWLILNMLKVKECTQSISIRNKITSCKLVCTFTALSNTGKGTSNCSNNGNWSECVTFNHCTVAVVFKSSKKRWPCEWVSVSGVCLCVCVCICACVFVGGYTHASMCGYACMHVCVCEDFRLVCFRTVQAKALNDNNKITIFSTNKAHLD